MANWSYIARSTEGQRITGQLQAASREAVLADLEARQLVPVRLQEVRSRRVLARRIGSGRLATLFRQLSDLLRAGVPLLRALNLLGRTRTNPRLAEVLRSVSDDIADGMRLGDAVAKHPSVFSTVQVAMIHAGERGGFLQSVLDRIGRFMEHQAEMRSRVLGSLIYPVLLLVVGLGVVGYALIGLVPKFRDLYAKIELPVATRLLLGLSDLAAAWWVPGLFILAAICLGLWWMREHSGFGRRWAAVELRLPLMGRLRRDLAVARFSRILGTLLDNGVPMLAAMEISREAAGNPLLEDAIVEATSAVKGGEPLAAPLGASGLFGEDIIEMISVGETANNLPEVLVTVADTAERRVERTLGMMLRIMEPLLLLAMAGMVVFIFVALVVPMMRLTASVQGG
ncbi:MAG: type II secretion system F family protein [Planctomycetota bacterium]|nr:type II secretion system F family protein [Planctomycetota bacterium]